MNNFNIAGRLVKEVEVKTSSQGKPYAFITVAVNMTKDKTEFIDVTCFAKTAEILGQYGKKGMSIAINGSIHKGDKEHGYALSLVANTITMLGNKEG